jgi:hypothetical protein
MKVNELESAVKALFESKRANLSEEYQAKLDSYAERTTNVKNLIALLNEENLAEALDNREAKREANLKYQAKKAEDENTFPNLFKNNFEIDLKNADYDSLASISKMLSSKLEEVQELMKKQKMSKIAELEAQLKELRERDF